MNHCKPYPTDTNPITHAQKFYIGAGLVTDLEIPANVNTVNAWSFTGYRGLKTLTIPSWVKRVGEGAFLGCLLILRDSEVKGFLEKIKVVKGYK